MRFDAPVPMDRTEVLARLDRALPEVYGYLLHRCRQRETAEDLTSETFLAAVRAVGAGKVDDVSVAWLIGIARHKLVDEWRRRAREVRHLETAAAERTDDPVERFEPGPAMEVLAMLSPMQRAALTLRHVDGLPVPEVAQLIGRSVHATETLLVRARVAFRDRYKSQEPVDE